MNKICGCSGVAPVALLGRQRGASLIVGMVMLLLLTMLGVAGMQNTLLQERMAGSFRDRQAAQQAAEAALRYAESQIKSASSYDASSINAVVLADTDAMVRSLNSNIVSEDVYWMNSAAWANGVQTFPSGNLDGLVSQPQYKVERLPAAFAKIPGTLNAGAAGGKRVTDYRITVKAVGTNATGAEVILQSIYRRVDG